MTAQDELVQLLADTRRWAANPIHIDTRNIYSNWPTHEALLNELDQHLADARNGLADFSKLVGLFAPTAGLCEVVTSDGEPNTYLSLAARFDAWCASVRKT